MYLSWNWFWRLKHNLQLTLMEQNILLWEALLLCNASEPSADQNEQSCFSKIGGVTLVKRLVLYICMCVRLVKRTLQNALQNSIWGLIKAAGWAVNMYQGWPYFLRSDLMYFSSNLAHWWTDTVYLYSKTAWGVKGKLKRTEERRWQTWLLSGLKTSWEKTMGKTGVHRFWPFHLDALGQYFGLFSPMITSRILITGHWSTKLWLLACCLDLGFQQTGVERFQPWEAALSSLDPNHYGQSPWKLSPFPAGTCGRACFLKPAYAGPHASKEYIFFVKMCSCHIFCLSLLLLKSFHCE